MKKKNKGFTLAELLVVVAIVGILVAISIPIFVKKLDSARMATDLANERCAKACALAKYNQGEIAFDQIDRNGGHYNRFAYDAENGVLLPLSTTDDDLPGSFDGCYGQGIGNKQVEYNVTGYQQGCNYTNAHIDVDFVKNVDNDTIEIYWVGVNKSNRYGGDNVFVERIVVK